MSDLLDKSVSRERTKFELPEQQNLVDDVGIEEIFEKLKEEALSFLSVDMEKSNQKKRNFIQNYVYNKM